MLASRPVGATPLVCLASALAACGTPTSYRAAEPAPMAASTSGPPGASEAVAMPTPAPPAEAVPERPGLGTVWGESRWSPVTVRPFERASAEPWAVAVIHYNDAEGVTAHAAYLGASLAPLEVDAGNGLVGVGLVDGAGQLLPGVVAGDRALVVGRDGEAYRIVVTNHSGARFEVVASVDGLDVIDGQAASPSRRGYLLEPGAVLTIDGFRQSSDSVAAFRFGRVADSYAARTGGDRDVGVVGLAFFAERGAAWTPDELRRRDTADPFPGRAYATPP